MASIEEDTHAGPSKKGLHLQPWLQALLFPRLRAVYKRKRRFRPSDCKDVIQRGVRFFRETCEWLTQHFYKHPLVLALTRHTQPLPEIRQGGPCAHPPPQAVPPRTPTAMAALPETLQQDAIYRIHL